MKNLTRCIKQQKIEFYGLDKQLDTSLDDFGEYNQNLVSSLFSQSNELIVRGEGLEHYLTRPRNVDELVEFLVSLSSVNRNGPIPC